MKKVYSIMLYLGTLLFVLNQVRAQDVHFSQTDFSPLTLNPALAGASATFQGIALYRTQYGSFATPYKTFVGSFDGRLSAGVKNTNGTLGAGLCFFNDRMGDGFFSQTTVGLNLAYSLKVSRFNSVALGLNSTFGQCAANPGVGQWGSQYDGSAFNPAMASGENFYQESFTYLDLGVGAVYTYQTDVAYITNTSDKGFSVGFAAYHVNNPRYSFYNSSIQNLAVRYSVFANANYGLDRTNGILQPGVYFQRQKKSNELLYGVSYKQIIQKASRETDKVKEIAFSLGLFSRLRDAVVVKSMVFYGPLSAGFSYDINTSRLSLVSNFRGGLEMFVRYNVNNIHGKRVRVK
ncbi:MAG: type IX secretion system membrane protein PorP/SprF [Flavobacteriia bacterium]|nr:type IX secretion system membrane protein PorP/SprF [Flavobacteriia bacterium]